MKPGDRHALNVLCAVRDQLDQTGVAPDVFELCLLTRIRHPKTVHTALDRLVAAGLLVADADGRLAVPKEWPAPVLAPAPPAETPDEPTPIKPGRSRKSPPYRQRGPRHRPADFDTYVDEVAVRLTLAGERCRELGRAEQVEAIRIAARRGWTDRTTGVRLGISSERVFRLRRKHGIPGQPVGTNQYGGPRGWFAASRKQNRSEAAA